MNQEIPRATLRNRENAARIWAKRKDDPVWREKKREYARRWRAANPDKKLASDRSWAAANPERVKTLRRAFQKKQRANPKFRAIHNLRKRLRQLVSRGRAVSVKQNQLVGCAPAFLVSYLSVRLQAGQTWENYGTVWHIDHVKPCAKFDLTKAREVKKCFHFSNLQPLWVKDNIDKLDRVPTQTELAI